MASHLKTVQRLTQKSGFAKQIADAVSTDFRKSNCNEDGHRAFSKLCALYRREEEILLIM